MYIPQTIVSVTEIEHRSPKYFVVTFVLCGAVAGIVLAVIIIYIFRRHVISKEKLQQLSTALGIEDEASKDYQVWNLSLLGFSCSCLSFNCNF